VCEHVWNDLITNVQPGWQEVDDDTQEFDDDDDTRRLEFRAVPDQQDILRLSAELITPRPGLQLILPGMKPGKRSLGGYSTNILTRRLQQNDSSRLAGCDVEWYTDGRMTNATRLWPVWKVRKESGSALMPEILKELCIAEEVTQRLLEEKGLCFGCDSAASEICLPLFGIVLYARLMIPNRMDLDCEDLADTWGAYQSKTELEWKACVEAYDTQS
jgi:hypothetical protein